MNHLKPAVILVSLLASPELAPNDADFVKSLSAKVVELSFVWGENARHEFVLVLNPLRVEGATASPRSAFALLP